nr:putative retrotransposon Ty1-copia subclass protein [Tanacetum cinerariifolium]
PNGKTVGSKWLFKKKTDMDRNVHIYKARLVAKGYTQAPGIDYEETFSPVADIRALRILIATAAYYDYEIWKIDVKTAFLNGYLNKEVYMEQPEGFVNPKYLNRVCKLKRSINGLKQASRQWIKRFDDEIKKFAVGFIMYAVRCTRPDVVFAQNLTSRFQQNPGDIHWSTVKNILKYLRNTKDMFLVYGGARQFRAKVHYLREVIEFGDIKLEEVHTDDNLADPFTKALAFPKHYEHTRNIGMLPASSLM